MGSATDDVRAREPGFGDYLKAAFNVRVHVPKLGGVPVNWLYLAAAAGLGVAAWPLGLVGAAGELALLTTLATSPRFQATVRAQKIAQQGGSLEAAMAATVDQLSPANRQLYGEFAQKCDDVLQIARKLGQSEGSALETYQTHLAELRDVYCRMLVFAELLSTYSRDWAKTDPQPEIARIEQELKDAKLDEQVLASRKATLEVLKKRAESRAEVGKRMNVLRSEIERLEQQVALLRDQALLTRDPSLLSQSMDVAAGVLEEHNSWLQENAAFLQSLDQVATSTS
ncbi:MAG: hypothetical protein WCP21_06380 [Armatimonadota bacterium]